MNLQINKKNVILNLQGVVLLIERYLLPILFSYQAFSHALKLTSFTPNNLILILDDILKPIVFAVLLHLSSSQKRIVNIQVFIGLILSYGALYFLEIKNELYLSQLNYIFYFSLIYYLVFSLFSILSLGKKFSILPKSNEIITKGPYSTLKHPIYSSYIHFFLVFVIFNHSIKNILLFVLFYFGIYLRSKTEEEALGKDYEVKMKGKPRYFNLIISLPIVIIFLSILISRQLEHLKNINVNIAYPVFSLNPHQADDWSSFFVMNHIYRRLQYKNGYYRSLKLINLKSIQCNNHQIPAFSSECKRIRVLYNITPNVKSCSGQSYTEKTFQEELEIITHNKNWIFPNFRWCQSQRNCFEFDNVPNIQNRLESIYLRFGWSLSDHSKGIYGLLPTCFVAKNVEDNKIYEGEIQTNNQVITVSTNNFDSDIYLYENATTNEGYKNVSYYNPIYYFLVINGSSLKTGIWINEKMIDEIRAIFNQYKIISEIKHNTSSPILPKHAFSKYVPASNKKVIVLPDFLEKCHQIKDKLQLISNLKNWGIRFICRNITDFVENKVKLGTDNWDAFISPLTPGFPGKESLETQYFNPQSVDSWLGKKDPSMSYVELIGYSEGSLAISNKYCSIKPNSLGLSDLNIDDLIECNH